MTYIYNPPSDRRPGTEISAVDPLTSGAPVAAETIEIRDFAGQVVRFLRRAETLWFVHADVCKVLGIANARQAAARLDQDEKGVITVDTLGGPQEMTLTAESGVYALTMTSRKPETKQFRRWVTTEVIPSIRRTGAYGKSDPMTILGDPNALRGLLGSYADRVIKLEAANAAMAPKAAALDRLEGAAGSVCISVGAKIIGEAPNALFKRLDRLGWIFRRQASGPWVGYQHRVDAGLLEHRPHVMTTQDGREVVHEQVLVTAKGLTRLAEILDRGMEP